MTSDKAIERSRYNTRASRLLSATGDLSHGVEAAKLVTGALAVPIELRAPYLFYEQLLEIYLADSAQALEICAGTGLHSGALLASGTGKVICSDISERSLEVLKTIHASAGNRLSVEVVDMESMPFEDNCFDVVACAGGLSYGAPNLVLKEIFRVLRPGGRFVCVDSFNENPIYRFNRWIHYLRGERTRSTLLQMPDAETIKAYERQFRAVSVRYFGAIAWLAPALKKLMDGERVAGLLDQVDSRLGVCRSAFKFVMVAQK